MRPLLSLFMAVDKIPNSDIRVDIVGGIRGRRSLGRLNQPVPTSGLDT